MAGQSPSVEKDSQGEAQRGQGESAPFSVPIRIIESPEEAQHARDREQKSDQHEADDLEAQRLAAESAERSATATEWQIIPAWAQLAFAVVGTGALLYTLFLTRQSVLNTRRIGEAQVRAYIGVCGVEIGEIKSAADLPVTVFLRNSGQTPGYNVSGWQKLTTDFKEVARPTDVPVDRFAVLGAGDKRGFPPRRPTIPPVVAAKVNAGDAALYVFGEITYVDVFNKPQTTKFRRRYIFNPKKPADRTFYATEDGNETT